MYDNRIKEAERAAAAEIEAIESVVNAQIKAIQDELAALEEGEKQKSRAELDAEDQKKIDRLQGKIEYEHDEYNRLELQKELNKVIAERDKRHQAEQLADKKDALKEEEKSLRDKLKEETDLIKKTTGREKGNDAGGSRCRDRTHQPDCRGSKGEFGPATNCHPRALQPATGRQGTPSRSGKDDRRKPTRRDFTVT
ncbi:hypothetical protein L3476_13895 [Paenibacillus thiaminolyticus]|uniref:hypothetical protein n=1 Tax=Paenibacillus thiaminolyticus TaxID=49283 RepID=UPI0023505CE7|nr:hypothetical protein [Paenibacillus thiaminolyticus]WCR29713.1 hypothetical protein L3476_13895 [Paenibacillus thiaminolyticus]